MSAVILPFPGKPERNEARIKEAFAQYVEARARLAKTDAERAKTLELFRFYKRHDNDTPPSAA